MNNALTELQLEALRIIATSLLGSPLKSADIGRLSEQIDDQFTDELKKLLAHFSEREVNRKKPTQPSDEKRKKKLEFLVLRHIRSKKIGKPRLYKYIREFNSKIEIDENSTSIQEMVENFIESSSEIQIQDLVNRISGNPEQDQYLIGISRG